MAESGKWKGYLCYEAGKAAACMTECPSPPHKPSVTLVIVVGCKTGRENENQPNNRHMERLFSSVCRIRIYKSLANRVVHTIRVVGC